MNNALTKDATLDNSTRSEFFIEINPIVAKTVKCKISDMAKFTLAEEYAQCVAAVRTAASEPQTCAKAEIQAPLAQMSDNRTSRLADYIANDTPLT